MLPRLQRRKLGSEDFKPIKSNILSYIPYGSIDITKFEMMSFDFAPWYLAFIKLVYERPQNEEIDCLIGCADYIDLFKVVVEHLIVSGFGENFSIEDIAAAAGYMLNERDEETDEVVGIDHEDLIFTNSVPIADLTTTINRMLYAYFKRGLCFTPVEWMDDEVVVNEQMKLRLSWIVDSEYHLDGIERDDDNDEIYG